MHKPIGTYQEVDTVGKSQIDLIIQVYNGALQALAAGRTAYEASDNRTGYEQLEKARKMVVHLYTTLDFDRGAEVAGNLGKLYVYILSQIDAIEATKSVSALNSCVAVLTDLRDGWQALKAQQPARRPDVVSVARADTVEISA